MNAKYIKPVVSIFLIENEGIATTSYSTVSFGDEQDPYNPKVEDWERSNLGSESFEL